MLTMSNKPAMATVVLCCMLLGVMLGFASLGNAPDVATEKALRGSASNEGTATKETLEMGEVVAAPAQRQRMLFGLPPTAPTAEEQDEDVAEEIVEVSADLVADKKIVVDKNNVIVGGDEAIVVGEDEAIVVGEDEAIIVGEDEAIIVGEDEVIINDEQEAIVGEDKEDVVFSWPEQAAETNGFWGPDNQERAQLAQFVAQGTWEQLDETDESFSFEFET